MFSHRPQMHPLYDTLLIWQGQNGGSRGNSALTTTMTQRQGGKFFFHEERYLRGLLGLRRTTTDADQRGHHAFSAEFEDCVSACFFFCVGLFVWTWAWRCGVGRSIEASFLFEFECGMFEKDSVGSSHILHCLDSLCLLTSRRSKKK